MINDVAPASPTESKLDGGRGTFIVKAGTRGRGTVQLQFENPDSDWIDADAELGTLDADGAVNFELPLCRLKVIVTTATGVYAWAMGALMK
jgi:hypothetical protein